MLEKNVQKCQEKAKDGQLWETLERWTTLETLGNFGKMDNFPKDGQLWEKYEWHLDPEYVYNKLVDQEDCFRRNNLRINDVKKKDGES